MRFLRSIDADGSIDEWRELVVAGRGISLCPASAEVFHARPGLRFVRAEGVPPAALCVAWRADDRNPVVHRFAEVVAAQAVAAAPRLDHLTGRPS